jgi:hypothetical protein
MARLFAAHGVAANEAIVPVQNHHLRPGNREARLHSGSIDLDRHAGERVERVGSFAWLLQPPVTSGLTRRTDNLALAIVLTSLFNVLSARRTSLDETVRSGYYA